MESMTVKEIAQAVGKDPATVSRWVDRASCKMQEVSCKVQEAKQTKKPARYTLPEVIEIIRTGAGDQVADTFATNAQTAASPSPQKKQLSGALLREMRMIYGKDGAASRIDQYMGFGSHENVEVYPVAANLGRISKQAYAVEMKIRQQRKNRQIEDKRSPDLFTEDQ